MEIEVDVFKNIINLNVNNDNKKKAKEMFHLV